MKKTISVLLSLIMLCGLLSLTSYAAGPGKPMIEGQMPDCYMELGGSGITLFTNASSPDGGTLEYQWYSADVAEMACIRAIDGETGKTFKVPEILGVKWYCYAVWNVASGGEKSEPVYSRLIRVEFYEPNVETVSVEIVETPDKVVYTSGECLDLKGLKVRVYTSDGYFDSLNGDKLTITKNPLVTVGEQKIKVAYGDAFDFFIVTVKAAHTHKFGEWMVTTKPTCTEDGIKARECDCGHTERAKIPALGHKWDDGRLIKEASADADGERILTCTVCKETKVEKVKAGEAASDLTGDVAELSESTIPSEMTSAKSEPSSGFPWWAIAVIAAVFVCCGTVCIVVIKKKK